MLFDLQAEAARRLGFNEEECICPICGFSFGKNGLVDGTLSMEHVPPKSIGGKILLLTCKRCNSLSGSSFDHQFKAAERFFQFKNALVSGGDNSGASVKLKIDGLTLNALLTTKIGKVNFQIGSEHNDSRDIEKYLPIWKKRGIRGFQLEYESQFSIKKYKLALLKSAFLLVTAKLGYSYGLDEALIEVRKQIMEPKEDHFKIRFLNVAHAPHNGILVSEDEGWVAVMLLGHVVPLPSPFPVGCDWEETIEKLASGTKSGIFLDFPKTFEGLIDFRARRSRLTI